MDSDDPIRISLDHASERGVGRLRALLAGVGRRAPGGSGRHTTTDPAAPRIEEGMLVVPRACARETWAVLFRSDDPRLLAFAFRLFGEIQERGWVPGLWRSGWDDGEAPPTRTLRACAPARRGAATTYAVRRTRTKVASSDHGEPPPNSVA